MDKKDFGNIDKNKYKISFIVPVYNVEEYIVKCIESILELDFNTISYEIIIINDGTKDNSINKVEDKFSNNPYIRIINQNNFGLSIARNVGLKHARGEYVSFIDGDDYINAKQLFKIINSIVGNEDIIIGNYYNSYPTHTDINKNRIPNHCSNSGKFFFKNYYLKDIYTVVWRNIYKRNYLINNNLFFYERITFEDVEWTPRVIYQAKKITFINIPFYYYRKRENSIINSTFTIKKFEDITNVAASLLKYSEDLDLTYKRIFHESASFFILLGLSHIKESGLHSQINESIAINIFKSLKYNSFKYKVLLTIYNLCPNLFYLFLKLKFERKK